MKVTIVAGAPHQDRAFINKNIDRQSFVIAADAGHRILDFEPDLIVGDFDSSERPDCNCPVVTLNPVKNDSDTWYGMFTQYRDYYLYALFPSRVVYASRRG